MSARLWKLLRRLSGVEPLATRLTAEQAIEIARRCLVGEGTLSDAGASPIVERGRIVWRVVTDRYLRGAHQQAYIDDVTGEVIRTHEVRQ